MRTFDVNPDGTTSYTTVDGDMVDAIAFDYYGTHDKSTVIVYEANPGLAAKGERLPIGVVITLPDRDLTPQPTDQVNLWD